MEPRHPEQAVAFNAMIATSPSAPFAELLPEMATPITTDPVAAVIRLAFIAVGIAIAIVSLALAIGAVVGRLGDPRLVGGFLMAATVQLMLIFDARTGVAEARYTWSIWPAIVLSLVLPL